MNEKRIIELLKRKIELLENSICSNSCLADDVKNELDSIDTLLEDLEIN